MWCYDEFLNVSLCIMCLMTWLCAVVGRSHISANVEEVFTLSEFDLVLFFLSRNVRFITTKWCFFRVVQCPFLHCLWHGWKSDTFSVTLWNIVGQKIEYVLRRGPWGPKLKSGFRVSFPLRLGSLFGIKSVSALDTVTIDDDEQRCCLYVQNVNYVFVSFGDVYSFMKNN